MSAPSTTTTSPAETANRRLARTINVGLDLGAPLERGWTVAVSDDHLARCADAGFTAVRLLVSLASHAESGNPERLDPVAVERIVGVVARATEHGLAVVLANMLDPALMAAPPAHRARLLASAREIAAATVDLGAEVLLEPLAEPQLALDPLWNDYLRDLVAAVRDVDPRRTLVAGPRSYNNARFLGELHIPDAEHNLIVSLHHYWPIRFTLQGEDWLGRTELGEPAGWLGTTWAGTPSECTELESGFAAVSGLAHARGWSIFLGEFGSTNHADMGSCVRWTRFNRELAEQHGFAWGYWSYGPSFALFDAGRGCWHADLLDALISAGR